MVLFSRSVLAVTLLVFLALCKVGTAQDEQDLYSLDARQGGGDGGGGDGDDGDGGEGDIDPVAVAECTECVHQQNLPDDQVEDAIAACVIKTTSDQDFDCSADNGEPAQGRALDSYLENRGWKPFKKIKSWFRRNRAKIIRALLRVRCLVRCARTYRFNPFAKRRCIAGCLRRYRG